MTDAENTSLPGKRQAVLSEPSGNGDALAGIFAQKQSVLALLFEAHRYAAELRGNIWDFAVEIDQLRRAGLTHSDLRWLVCKGFVEHACEVTLPGEEGRAFRPSGRLTFRNRTAVVLTAAGADFARQMLSKAMAGNGLVPEVRASEGAATVAGGNGAPPADTLPLPRWDRDRQELRLGSYLVKQFKVPAPNQEMILAVFQEEGWPPRVDDPLPPQPELDAKRRLHDTINSLNRHQKAPLVRFVGDGSGQGVRWERGQHTNGDGP